jgi:hypothetical protein
MHIAKEEVAGGVREAEGDGDERRATNISRFSYGCCLG